MCAYMFIYIYIYNDNIDNGLCVLIYVYNHDKYMSD